MTEIKSNLKIEEVPLEQIYDYEKNIKTHDEEQIIAIAQSIDKFGFNNPILVNEKGEIIAGHGRYAAAQLLELDTVPVIRLKHLTDTQARLYRIADNKLSEKGKWDLDMLKIEINELEALTDTSKNLEITDTGFDILEIDSLFVEKEKNEQEKIDEKSNTVPYIPDDEIVTKPGDIWTLGGKHRIICGDSLKEETYQKLLGDVLADVVLTDPPYNLSANSIGNSGNTKHEDFAMAAGEMSDEEFCAFLQVAMQRCSDHAKPNALHYFWMDWRHAAHILFAGHKIFPLFINMCVWVKSCGGLGRLYRSQHELCFVFGNDKHYVDNTKLGSRSSRYRTNVWHYAGVNSFGPHKGDQKMHPTVKSMEMFRDIILDSTPRGGIVLDAFSGSGTTIIAAEKCHRIGFAIEYEPKYVDTLLRRYKELFGVDAVLEGDGRTYSEILAEHKKSDQ
jgi:DNA modification methylase